MKPSAASGFGLVREQQLQSGALAFALCLVTTLSAPTAFYVVRVGELRDQARAVAGQVARRVGQGAYERPSLWQYDLQKLIQEVERFREQGDVERILILDHERTLLADERLRAPVASPLVWESAEIESRGAPLGVVWIAASLGSVRASALELILPFFCVGTLLAGLLYQLPLRALGRAERRIFALVAEIEASRHELAERNSGLSQELARRVVELEAAYAALQQRDARLRALSSRAAALHEAERRAIARDLHDATGQTLTAMRINLQVLQHAADKPAEVERLRRSTLALVDAAIDEIRRAVQLLGPAIVGEVGLASAVATHCRDVAERTGLEIDCLVPEQAASLSPAIETAVYRIVQEALHNVVRHSRATRVEVALELEAALLVLRVENDGGPSDADLGRGRGLANMRERAELLGGSFAIEKSATDRIRVRVELPWVAAVEGRPEPVGGRV